MARRNAGSRRQLSFNMMTASTAEPPVAPQRTFWQPGSDITGHLHGEGGEETKNTRVTIAVRDSGSWCQVRMMSNCHRPGCRHINAWRPGSAAGQQRMEEELERGVDFVRPAPDTGMIRYIGIGSSNMIDNRPSQRTEYADHPGRDKIRKALHCSPSSVIDCHEATSRSP